MALSILATSLATLVTRPTGMPNGTMERECGRAWILWGLQSFGQVGWDETRLVSIRPQ